MNEKKKNRSLTLINNLKTENILNICKDNKILGLIVFSFYRGSYT